MKKIYTLSVVFLALICISMNADAQCIDDTHSPFSEDAWLSCSESISPNAERGSRHWIMYDLGFNYMVDSIYWWNYNVWGETGSGARDVVIDYSDNGTDWSEAGIFEFPKAAGSWKYTGTTGPKLEISGRYILINILSTWDNTADCAGIGEIKFVLGESVAAKDAKIKIDFIVSPNPATDYVEVLLPDQNDIERVAIYTATGQKIEETIYPASNVLRFNTIDFAAGTYFIHAFGEKTTGSKSIVVIK